MKLRQIGAAIAGAVLAVTMVACGGSSQSSSGSADSASKTYIIATDTTFAPFEFADSSNTYVGIDIELLDAIAKDQGFDYKLDPLGFDAALQSLQSNQADGVIAGMSITEERKKVFDFSNPYYDATVCCAVKADSNIASLEDLRDKTVAVKEGTTSAKWAESIKDQYGFKIEHRFEKSDYMYSDVTSGNCAACFEDTPVMGYAITQGVDLKIMNEVASDSEYATQYGFAVNKGQNAELLEKFNKGLENVKKDGTFDKIVDKYTKSTQTQS